MNLTFFSEPELKEFLLPTLILFLSIPFGSISIDIDYFDTLVTE
jgi:hypothetical protein